MFMGPATFVVTLIVGICLVVGALVLASTRQRRRRRVNTCPSCGRRNPSNAQYCAGCGHTLSGSET
jgi:hypothetical protein